MQKIIFSAGYKKHLNMKNKLFLLIKRVGIKNASQLVFTRLTIMLFAFPIACILFLLSPLIEIHLIRLFSSRIGHYALNTELLLCFLDTARLEKKRQRIFFYTAAPDPICNMQLHHMWKRELFILPFPLLCHEVNRFLVKLKGKDYQNSILKKYELPWGAQDRYDFLRKNKKIHLTFTAAEETAGQNLLKQLGISVNQPFVCLLMRDAGYLKKHMPENDWSYHEYRNVNIENYYEAAEFLAEKGYYVVRMGKYTEKNFWWIIKKLSIMQTAHSVRIFSIFIFVPNALSWFQPVLD